MVKGGPEVAAHLGLHVRHFAFVLSSLGPTLGYHHAYLVPHLAHYTWLGVGVGIQTPPPAGVPEGVMRSGEMSPREVGHASCGSGCLIVQGTPLLVLPG